MDFQNTLEESRNMQGALGAVAFVVRKTLESTGASKEELLKLDEQLQGHFSKLSDAQCNTLSEVVFQRLQEEKASSDRWY